MSKGGTFTEDGFVFVQFNGSEKTEKVVLVSVVFGQHEVQISLPNVGLVQEAIANQLGFSEYSQKSETTSNGQMDHWGHREHVLPQKLHPVFPLGAATFQIIADFAAEHERSKFASIVGVVAHLDQ